MHFLRKGSTVAKFICVFFTGVLSTAYASAVTVGPDVAPEAVERISDRFSDAKIQYIGKSDFIPWYEVLIDGRILYVSNDLEHLFVGALLESASTKNLSEQSIKNINAKLGPSRLEAIAKISQAARVTYKAPNEKYRVTVFTDVDCGYCRKLHQEMADFNKLGITVDYLAFPRAGINSSSYDKMVSIWCADDKKRAMDDAKLKQTFNTKTCTHPINSHLDLVQKFGLGGTPSVVLPTGELHMGYISATALKALLDQKNK